ncbi:hypothetical protein Bca4012_030008 [Brassica carinata]
MEGSENDVKPLLGPRLLKKWPPIFLVSSNKMAGPLFVAQLVVGSLQRKPMCFFHLDRSHQVLLTEGTDNRDDKTHQGGLPKHFFNTIGDQAADIKIRYLIKTWIQKRKTPQNTLIATWDADYKDSIDRIRAAAHCILLTYCRGSRCDEFLKFDEGEVVRRVWDTLLTRVDRVTRHDLP